MHNLKKRYILNHEKIIWGKLSNKYLIIIIEEGILSYTDIDIKKILYATTKSGIDILNSLLAEKSTEKIIKSLAKKYNLTPQKAKRDLKTFINQLLKKDLLQTTE